MELLRVEEGGLGVMIYAGQQSSGTLPSNSFSLFSCEQRWRMHSEKRNFNKKKKDEKVREQKFKNKEKNTKKKIKII